MVAARNTRRIVSPVLLVGVVSVAVVTGVSALRLVSAEQPGQPSSQSVKAEIKSSVSSQPEANVQVESTVTSEPSPADNTGSAAPGQNSSTSS